MNAVMPGGWPEIQKTNHRLAIKARRILSERLNVEIPCPERFLGSMASLPLPAHFQATPKTTKIDPEQQMLYDVFGIEVPMVRLGEPQGRFFRISCQLYNCIEEYQYLADALKLITVQT
jgi:isopenicillin-N epimerase